MSRLQRARHYEQCLHLLEQHLPDSPPVAELRAEIEQLPDTLTHHASRTACRLGPLTS